MYSNVLIGPIIMRVSKWLIRLLIFVNRFLVVGKSADPITKVENW